MEQETSESNDWLDASTFLKLNGHHSSGNIVGLPTETELLFVSLNNVIRCEAENMCTTFFMDGKKKILVRKTLKQCESFLDSKGFVRVHKSHLINTLHMIKLNRGGYIHLSDGWNIQISQKRKSLFYKAISRI